MRRAVPSERGADLGMRADAPPAVQQRGHRETPRRLRGEWQYSEGEGEKQNPCEIWLRKCRYFLV